MSDLAYVIHQGQCYYTEGSFSQGTPSSAVVKLLQGIFEIHKDHSFFILRQRLWTNQKLGAQELGMVKVIAKRISFEPFDSYERLTELSGKYKMFSIGNPDSPFQFLTADCLALETQSLPTYFDRQQALVGLIFLQKQIPRGSVLHDHPRPVSALMLDKQGQILGAAVNTATINKTRHAEVNLVQSYYLKTGQKTPAGAQIFVTHKPCKMCAGMIWDNSEDPYSLRVFYLIEEIGSQSRNTILDQTPGVQSQIVGFV